MKAHNVTLNIAENLYFKIEEPDSRVSEIIGPTNIEAIIRQHFSGDIPTDGEVEAAIYSVEEAIREAEKKLVNIEDKTLTIKHPLAKKVFSKKGNNTIRYNDLEQLNYRYADYIAGMPSSYVQLEFSTIEYTLVLILREIMHHFKFNRAIIA